MSRWYPPQRWLTVPPSSTERAERASAQSRLENRQSTRAALRNDNCYRTVCNLRGNESSPHKCCSLENRSGIKHLWPTISDRFLTLLFKTYFFLHHSSKVIGADSINGWLRARVWQTASMTSAGDCVLVFLVLVCYKRLSHLHM